MRDDLAGLFDLIREYQDKKIALLASFRNKEFEIKQMLSTGIVDTLKDILDSENEIMENIDLCNYEISSAIDRIKSATGIDLLKTGIETYIKDEAHFAAYRERAFEIERIFNDINQLKTENLKKMESVAWETSLYSDELNRIDKVHRRFAKDLQSS